MKALTNEGWTGLIALIINLIGAALKMFLPGEWTEAIPLILAVLNAAAALLVWYLGRKTRQEIARIRGH